MLAAGADVVVVVVVPLGSGSESSGAVVVVVWVSIATIVLVVVDEAVGPVGSPVDSGTDVSDWTGSGSNSSVLLIAIVVGGSIGVGVSVTWSRTLLTAAEAMSTAANVTASQMSG